MEMRIAMLEIVAVLLPLSFIALGLVFRRIQAADKQQIFGGDFTKFFGSLAGFTLLLISAAGGVLSFFVLGYAEPYGVQIAGGLLLLTFASFGTLGIFIHLFFENSAIDDNN